MAFEHQVTLVPARESKKFSHDLGPNSDHSPTAMPNSIISEIMPVIKKIEGAETKTSEEILKQALRLMMK